MLDINLNMQNIIGHNSERSILLKEKEVLLVRHLKWALNEKFFMQENVFKRIGIFKFKHLVPQYWVFVYAICP